MERKRKLPEYFTNKIKKIKEDDYEDDQPIYIECQNETPCTGFNQIPNDPYPQLALKFRDKLCLILDEKVENLQIWLTTSAAREYLQFLIDNKNKKKKEKKIGITKKKEKEIDENKKREMAIDLYIKEYSWNYISGKVNKSIKQVKNIIQTFKKYGRSYLLGSGINQQKLTTNQTKKMEDFWAFEKNEKLTNKESHDALIKNEIIEENKIKAGTLGNYRKRLGFTRKRARKRKIRRYTENVCEKRFDFVIDYLSYLHNNFEMIVIDECPFNVSMANDYGWTKKGKEFVQKIPQPSKNITLILAITKTKILGYQIYIPGVNGKDFVCFLINIIKQCKLEEKLSNIVFVYDGVNTHKLAEYQKRFFNKINYLTTPAYCPYFKCIEEVFGKVKKIVKKKNALSIDERILSIHNALYQITEEDLINYFENVYNYCEKSFNNEDI